MGFYEETLLPMIKKTVAVIEKHHICRIFYMAQCRTIDFVSRLSRITIT